MSFVKRYWFPAVGVAVLLTGTMILHTTPTSFGWFAYAPLSDTAYVPPFVQPQTVAGLAVIALGLVLVAGWVGFVIGRRDRA